MDNNYNFVITFFGKTSLYTHEQCIYNICKLFNDIPVLIRNSNFPCTNNNINLKSFYESYNVEKDNINSLAYAILNDIINNNKFYITYALKHIIATNDDVKHFIPVVIHELIEKKLSKTYIKGNIYCMSWCLLLDIMEDNNISITNYSLSLDICIENIDKFNDFRVKIIQQRIKKLK
jgi:hypothetical protein